MADEAWTTAPADPACALGRRPLAGRQILILPEQGIGDEVMFGTCLPQVADRRRPLFFPVRPAARSAVCEIAAECDAAREDGRPMADPVAARLRPLRLCGEPAPTISPQDRRFSSVRGLFKAGSGRRRQVAIAICPTGRALKVGISWRGGKDRRNAAEAVDPAGIVEAVFPCSGRAIRQFAIRIQPPPKRLSFAIVSASRWMTAPIAIPLVDLDGFAAKIAALDLVVSVDNSTIHLAAAIGRPVWTLLPFCSDWRWMLEGETTPWYPTMRLLRCRTLDGWPELMLRTARLLTEAIFSARR